MENRNLFVVVDVKFEYVAFVCNWVRAIRLQLPTSKSAFKRDACDKTLGVAARPNHRNPCLMKEL